MTADEPEIHAVRAAASAERAAASASAAGHYADQTDRRARDVDRLAWRLMWGVLAVALSLVLLVVNVQVGINTLQSGMQEVQTRIGTLQSGMRDVQTQIGTLRTAVRNAETEAAAPVAPRVQVVGCLTRRDDGGWALTRATHAVLTDDLSASSAETLAALAGRPLGTRTFELVAHPDLAAHAGHTMEAKGFLLPSPDEDRIAARTLGMVASTCDP